MLDRAMDLFKLTVAVGVFLLILAGSQVEARRGSNCICYYSGDCIYDEQGKMYRYYQCTGSCYDYSGYRYNPKCSSMRSEESIVYDDIELV